MKEWIKKVLEQIKTLWSKWSLVQKLVLIGVVVAALAAVIALVGVSSSPTQVSVIDAPIRDEDARDRILTRINTEGVRAQVNSAGIITVADDATARRMRAILIRENLVPTGTDPWALFDRDRWTITDFERNVNLQRAITQMVTDHIRALDDVDDANVTIVMPESKLFAADQNPVTASVIITPRPGSDITQNRKKIEGIQKILQFAVEGLRDDNIVIADQSGLVLNDFAGMTDMDRQGLIERQQRYIRQLETQYRAKVLNTLQNTYTADRVRDLDIKIEMDMSQKTIATDEYYPITIKERTPGLPYDDSERANSFVLSQSTSRTDWTGTGFNPEGPAGVEGQTPPAYRDMSNLAGTVNQETLIENNVVNNRKIQEERMPTINRITVSVNIDGEWKRKYDVKGKPMLLPSGTIDREYAAIPAEDIRNTVTLIQNAIGYSPSRGDAVTVQNIRFDRARQFEDEDTAYFKSRQFQTGLLIALSGVAALLIGFVALRLVTREVERRRRVREEELSAQHAAMRDAALRRAEEEGVEVSMSVEERKRMELQETAINMAKEHPDNVAQLIRTWLLEE